MHFLISYILSNSPLHPLTPTSHWINIYPTSLLYRWNLQPMEPNRVPFTTRHPTPPMLPRTTCSWRDSKLNPWAPRTFTTSPKWSDRLIKGDSLFFFFLFCNSSFSISSSSSPSSTSFSLLLLILLLILLLLHILCTL